MRPQEEAGRGEEGQAPSRGTGACVARRHVPQLNDILQAQHITPGFWEASQAFRGFLTPGHLDDLFLWFLFFIFLWRAWEERR